MRYRVVILGATFFALIGAPLVADAALIDQVNQAFRQVHGKNPTLSEWSYWAGRVQRGEKSTYQALVGAIGFQKSNGNTVVLQTGLSAAPTVTAASFKVDRNLYPSAVNPNFYPMAH